MENNKIILNYCRNFNKIINTDFLENDTLSKKLVNIYKDYIFKINIHNEDDIIKAQTLDQTMSKYVDDYFFRKILKEEILNLKVKKNTTDLITIIIDSIINIFKKYEEDKTRKIYLSKWI